jgi:hypothetical protein
MRLETYPLHLPLFLSLLFAIYLFFSTEYIPPTPPVIQDTVIILYVCVRPQTLPRNEWGC